MNKRTFLIFVFGVIIFCGLVGYNYLIAQKEIFETKPSPLGIYLNSFPEKVVVGQTGTFIWSIDSSPDLSTSRTTIYWGYTASPSALTMQDSPDAVSYPYHQDDYYQGIFKLPDTFNVSVLYPKTGTIYARAYAKVGNKHLWTDEKSIQVISSQENVNQ